MSSRHILYVCLFISQPLFLKTVIAIYEEIEATPTNTNAVELGELSWPQFLLMSLIFLKIYLLYALGIIPIAVDLGAPELLKSALMGFRIRNPPETGENNQGQLNQVQEIRVGARTTGGQPRALDVSSPQISLNTLLYDCPLQYICELEFWANKAHDSFWESLLASWFKSENATFANPKGAAFAGMGSCKEMYPCPFDVHEVVGVRVPGTTPMDQSETNELGDSVDRYEDFS